MQSAVYLGRDRLLVELDQLDMVYICDSSDSEAVTRLLRCGEIAPAVSAYLQRNVGPTWTCVDIDAGPGYFASLLGKLASNGQVHAFESAPIMWALLAENIAANGLAATVVRRRAAIGRGAEYCVGPGTHVEDFAPTLTLDLHWRHGLGCAAIDLVRIGDRTLPSLAIAGAAEAMAANPLCHFLVRWDPAAIESLGHAPRFEAAQLVRALPRPAVLDTDGRLEPTDWRAILDSPLVDIVATMG